MNSDEKLNDLASKLDIKADELQKVKNKKNRKYSFIVFIFSIIALLTGILGFSYGRDLGTYPFRIFIGPFTIVSEKKDINILKLICFLLIGFVIIYVSYFISYSIGYDTAPHDSGITTSVIDGTTFYFAPDYGVFSLKINH